MNKVTLLLKQGGMLLKKHAPLIMQITGTAAIGVGTVLACRATTKLHETLDKAEAKKLELEARREELEEHEFKREQTKLYAQNIWALVKLYGPSVLTLVGGVILLNGSSIVLRRRNTALAAAYAVLRESYEGLKQKAIQAKVIEGPIDEEHGDEVLSVNSDGEKPKPGDVKTFWFMYDELNVEGFSDSPFANLEVLKCKENWLNQRLLRSDQCLLTINEIMETLNFRYKRFEEGDHWCVTFDPSPNKSVDYSHLVDLGYSSNANFMSGLDPCTELKITCVYKPQGMPKLIEA